MPTVSFVRNELRALVPQYRVVRDAIAGEIAVKAAGLRYLPRPNPEDTSKEATARYDAYRARAVFYGVTGRTQRGMVGQIFSRPPQITVPSVLEHVIKDVNGIGVSAKQQCKQTTGGVVAYGRAGLLSEFPTMERPATAEEIVSGKVKPSINKYGPEQIINWRYGSDGGDKVLTLVVLEETYMDDDGPFETTERKRWRVLRLDDSGFYVQNLYRDKSTEVYQTFTPTWHDGSRMDYIPFDFIGSEDNDPDPDPVTMFDIANLNIAHYRNSADYEESVFMLGQPTPVFTGLNKEWVDTVLNGKVLLGSRSAVMLPPTGTAQLLQAEPNTLAAEAMAHKERQMVALGAKLVEQQQVQRTATEASQEESAEASQLSTIADNVSAAYMSALENCERMVSPNKSKIEFILNTKFDLSDMSPESRAQTIKEWQGGAITWTEMRAVLRRGGTATEEDEAARKKVEEEMGAAAARLDTDPAKLNDPAADNEE